MNFRLIAFGCLGMFSSFAASAWCAPITGELRTWHKVTLTFDGPEASESGDPNPFTDYRLNVTFRREGKQYVVPGYYAADGNAANTSAEAGNKWRVHFSPDAIGKWTYSVSFRKGPNVAVSEDPAAGKSAGDVDGETGSFVVTPTDKSGRDFRAKGRLEYDGTRYMRFAETGDYFLKCGVDAPENFLAYADFDGNFKSDRHKDDFVKTWQPHLRDWRRGDPAWQGDKGRGIIGALNYVAAKGLNGFSTLTMNINGDDRNVFPYTSYEERLRFDVSRLDQWEIVFEHADRLGLHIQLKTQETENETLLDNGDVGPQRRLYYRELIARFGHHLAVTWNMGEENGRWNANHKKKAYQSTEQRLAMAQYFHDHDPYHHLIVNHNGQSFDDLLGPKSKYTGASVQTNRTDFSHVHGAVLNYINKSAKAGKQWVVACDEPGDATHSLIPDKEDPDHDNARKNALWGTFMAGAQGIEWYFGYAHPHSDLTCQDFRSRDKMWDQCRIALEFFEKNSIPFWRMHSADGLVSNDRAYCFCEPGSFYVVFLKEGGASKIDLGKSGATYGIGWYNPRRGGELLEGTKKTVSGAGIQDIGVPPSESGNDWVALIRKTKG